MICFYNRIFVSSICISPRSHTKTNIYIYIYTYIKIYTYVYTFMYVELYYTPRVSHDYNKGMQANVSLVLYLAKGGRLGQVGTEST